ncbi:hypothetical protein PJ15_3106 [Acinetobacter sp. neg1]|nr:hypothetical protein PJ15_3106 [Acinetobacter sp. neg1]
MVTVKLNLIKGHIAFLSPMRINFYRVFFIIRVLVAQGS